MSNPSFKKRERDREKLETYGAVYGNVIGIKRY